jgi:hypothetical protein
MATDDTQVDDDIRHLSANFGYLLALRRNAQFVRDEFDVDITYSRPEQPREIWRGGLHLVTNEVMPTFLLMKLAIFVDDCMNMLVRRRCPALDPIRMRFSSKVKILSQHHKINRDSFRMLKQLRNRCAHEFLLRATWDQLQVHLDEAVAFLEHLDPRMGEILTQIVKDPRAE